MENNVYEVVGAGFIWNGESAIEALSAFRSRPNARIWVSLWQGEHMSVPSIEITEILKATIRESIGRGE